MMKKILSVMVCAVLMVTAIQITEIARANTGLELDKRVAARDDAYTSSCHIRTTSKENRIEYWGVVVVNVEWTLEPYIYDALMASDNWNEDHLRLLWKENATRGAIIDSITWLNTNADANDIVLFACDIHGTHYDDNYGIWPWDGFTEGIITVEELDRKFDEITAHAMCLIFDTCLSGNFVDVLSGENRVIIVSSMKNGLAAHDYNLAFTEESSLTSFFGEALNQKIDSDNDGICSAEEAFEYAQLKWRPYAIRCFINVPVQLIMRIMFGYFYKPFPSMDDHFIGNFPLITL